MRYESSVTSLSWIPSEAVVGGTRLPFDAGCGPLRPTASRRARRSRRTAGGRPLPIRQSTGGLYRGRQVRLDQKRRLSGRWPDRQHHGPCRWPQSRLPSGRTPRHATKAGTGRRLGALHPDRRRPHGHARADARAPGTVRAVASTACMDHALPHDVPRRSLRRSY